MKRPVCGDCVWWVEDEKQLSGAGITSPIMGDCFYDPPKAFPLVLPGRVPGSVEVTATTIAPKAAKDGFCSKFQVPELDIH